MFGIDDALLGGVIAGGLSFLGGERRNSSQAAQAEQANAFSAQQFATRYQTTTKDMEAAGLNPMLAYSQGGGTPPSGQQAQMQDTLTPGVQSFNQARAVGLTNKINTAQIANIEADTANKNAQADLIAGQAAQAWASAGQSHAQTGLINENVKKTVQEVENLKTDNERIKAVIDNLFKEGQNLYKQNLNLTEVGNLLRAQWSEIQAKIPLLRQQTSLAEAEELLKRLDADAAMNFDNLGRNAKEIRPVLEILKMLVRK